MAIALVVKWVEQSDRPEPYQRIRHIGGSSGAVQWKHTHAHAIEFIERGQFSYFVEKGDRPFRLEVGRAVDGRKYLTVQSEGDQSEILLDLPGFPGPAPVNPSAPPADFKNAASARGRGAAFPV